MLDELHVRNLGVIEDARIEPGPGLVVVTGETGAGKTLLLGAMRLLLGLPARGDSVGPRGGEAQVDGRFILPAGDELAVSRRVLREGRSRAYLNGAAAPLRAVEEATAGLVEMVAQHDHLALTKPGEVRALVDRKLDGAGRRAVAAYRAAWERLGGLRADQERLGGDPRALARELDLVDFQAREIAAAGFSPGDDRRLLELVERLRHAEELLERLGTSRQALSEAQEHLGAAVAQLRKAVERDAQLAALLEGAEAGAVSLGELAHDTRVALESMSHDPAELEEVEQRLALLGDLRRKYGADLDEVLQFGVEAQARGEELRALLERADVLDRQLADAEDAVATAGEALRTARQAAGARVEKAGRQHLEELGFTAPVIRVEIESAAPAAAGADTLRLLFSSDVRLQPGPVSRVASGGELSRLVLALRLAGGAGEAPVVAFDEVDAGVGGRTALALGRKLAALAQERQVLCVTHLPQVAAFADTHYVVDRQGTDATVRLADGEQRLEELTRMLAGLPGSERGRDHAEELRRVALGERG